MATDLNRWAKKLDTASKREFPELLRKVLVAGSLRAAAEAKRRATGQGGPRVRSGRLRSSIRSGVRGRGLESEMFVSANTEYAATQEYGATIVPRSASWLTIPLPSALTGAGVARASAANFQDLFWFQSASGQPFLARTRGDGEIELMFILRKQVVVPPRPYLRPAIKQAARELPEALHKALLRVVGVP